MSSRSLLPSLKVNIRGRGRDFHGFAMCASLLLHLLRKTIAALQFDLHFTSLSSRLNVCPRSRRVRFSVRVNAPDYLARSLSSVLSLQRWCSRRSFLHVYLEFQVTLSDGLLLCRK